MCELLQLVLVILPQPVVRGEPVAANRLRPSMLQFPSEAKV
ncbi:hypothetical protein [Paenarthrobacter sp. YIM B13468]